MYNIQNNNLYSIFGKLPDASAVIQGNSKYSQIHGVIKFYGTAFGVLVTVDVYGLPNSVKRCVGNIYAIHIHDGMSCTGTAEDPFANAGTHYNPTNCPHPYHAGDMPPLFSAGKRAFSAFLTNRFRIDEIIGRTVILHDGYDDFTTQPSGNSGNKIACGTITRVRR